MKLLTICIPCFNSIEIMHKSISSCLLMKDEVEVLIIDNGSTDETFQVAKEYESAYPDTVRVLANTERKSVIPFALEYSQGLYFKLLECQDYFDQPSLVHVIETLRDIIRIQANLDLMITDYKIALPEKKEKKINYGKNFPTETLFGWHSLKHINQDALLNHASVIVKTNILKQITKENKEFHFYSELMGYILVPYVKSIYYLDTYFYCYGKKQFNFENKSSQYYYDLYMELFHFYDVYSLKSRKQRHYLFKYLSSVFMITNMIMIKDEEIGLKEQLWEKLYIGDPKLFKEVKRNVVGKLSSIDNKVVHSILTTLYYGVSKYY